MLKRQTWPWLAVVSVFVVAAVLLRFQGRSWLCSCGQLFLWAGDIWSAHNSQHLLDPYSFTHVLHGFVLCWLIALCIPRVSWAWRLCFALSLEATWEVFENTEFVIDRYRETTAALGYHGDSIVNSLGDILLCGIGFAIAQQLRFWRSLLLFAAMELVLLVWIRDSLLLEVLMLIYPIDALKAWQVQH
jgi:hypothetical protein